MRHILYPSFYYSLTDLFNLYMLIKGLHYKRPLLLRVSVFLVFEPYKCIMKRLNNNTKWSYCWDVSIDSLRKESGKCKKVSLKLWKILKILRILKILAQKSFWDNRVCLGICGSSDQLQVCSFENYFFLIYSAKSRISAASDLKTGSGTSKRPLVS